MTYRDHNEEIMDHLRRRADEIEAEANEFEQTVPTGPLTRTIIADLRKRAHALRVQSATYGIVPTASQIKRDAERDETNDYDYALGKDGRFAE